MYGRARPLIQQGVLNPWFDVSSSRRVPPPSPPPRRRHPRGPCPVTPSRARSAGRRTSSGGYWWARRWAELFQRYGRWPGDVPPGLSRARRLRALPPHPPVPRRDDARPLDPAAHATGVSGSGWLDGGGVCGARAGGEGHGAGPRRVGVFRLRARCAERTGAPSGALRSMPRTARGPGQRLPAVLSAASEPLTRDFFASCRPLRGTVSYREAQPHPV